MLELLCCYVWENANDNFNQNYSAHNIKWDCHFEIYFFSRCTLSSKLSAIRTPNILFQIWLIHY